MWRQFVTNYRQPTEVDTKEATICENDNPFFISTKRQLHFFSSTATWLSGLEKASVTLLELYCLRLWWISCTNIKTNHHSTLFTKELRAAVAVAVPASTPQPLTFMTLNSLETSNANDPTVLSTAVVLFQCQTALVVKPSLVAGLSRLHVCNSSSPFYLGVVTSTILQNELESHLSNIDIYLPSEMTFLFSAEVAL